jgi:hypothetical protein
MGGQPIETLYELQAVIAEQATINARPNARRTFTSVALHELLVAVTISRAAGA